MILKYFLPFCGLYFNFLDSVFFDAQKRPGFLILNCSEVQFFFTRVLASKLVHLLLLLSCLTLLQPHGLSPARLLCPWDFPVKHAGVGFHFLLQGTFQTEGLNSRLLH